jgi:hypothetical protein
MTWHFPIYEKLAFFTLTATTAGSTHNDLAAIMLASHRLGQQVTHSRTTVFLTAKRILRGA